MYRRIVLQGLVGVPFLHACSRPEPVGAASSGAGAAAVASTNKPAEFWRDKVSPQAYAVLFNEDTERAFSSPLDAEKRVGRFICAACYLPLFDSSSKFDSGTGWPSFTQPVTGAVATKKDFLMVLPRTEYHCMRCGGHQGHLFDDGPKPLGTRYCNNGLALAFVPLGEALPALRG